MNQFLLLLKKELNLQIVWILFFFTSLAQAATNPPLWRFNLDLGYGKMNYTETDISPVTSDEDIDQTALFVDFSFLQYIVAPGIDLTAGAQIYGLSPSEPENENEQFQSTYGYVGLGFNFYTFSDYFSVRLVLEGFTQDIATEGDFGFSSLFGAQAYPEFEILPFGTDMFMQISPFLKLPLLTDSGKRREFTVGLKVKLPTTSNTNQMKFPAYAYQKAIVFKLFYRKVDLLFEKSGFIPLEIETSELIGTIGFSF